MNVIPTHRVQEIGVLVNNILIVEEELIRFQQLLLFDIQLIGFYIVSHYVIVFHIVVADGLTSEHDEVLSVNHMKSY